MSKITLVLLALWFVPIIVLIWSMRKWPRRVGMLTGISFGLIVSPASFGLYGLYYAGSIVGFLGLASLFIHDSLPYYIATTTGLIPDHTVVEGIFHFYMLVISALVWSIIYGSLGVLIDALRYRAQAVRLSSDIRWLE